MRLLFWLMVLGSLIYWFWWLPAHQGPLPLEIRFRP